MPSCRLFLSCFGEIAYSFQISDDSGKVIYIGAVAHGAFLEVTLVDMSTVVADGVGDVEGEIVAAFAGGHSEELAVLVLAEVFLQVAVQRRAAGQVFDVLFAVQAELVQYVGVRVFHDVEIAVVAVAMHLIAVFLVPLGMFHAHVLGRDHLAVEHEAVLLRVVLLVIAFDEAQNILYEMFVIGVVGDRNLEELGGFDEAVDADGEVLAAQVDVAGVEQRQHAFGLEGLKVLVVADLYLMAEVDDLLKEGQVVHVVARGVLDAAVEVDGEHALGTCGHATCAKGVTEAIVLNLVAQTAA